MSNTKIKNYFFYFLLLCFVAIILELFCFTIYKLNPAFIFDWHFDRSAFDQTYKSSSPYGWISPEPMPRPANFKGHECAVSFGDSFTFGEEVQQSETWEDQASSILSCKISNYGVGGFGLDQTVLLYEGLAPKSELVLVGLYPEMMKRNVAASWIFYGSLKDKPLKPYFTIDTQSKALQQIPMPDSDAIEKLKAYHREDLYFQAYDIKFPYSLHAIKAPLIRARQILAKRIDFLRDSKVNEIQLGLLNRFRASIHQNQAKPAFIVFPSHPEIIKGQFIYLGQLLADKALTPEDCIINPGPELHHALKNNQKIFAPAGHFNQLGNLIVANVVATQLRNCKLLK